MMKQIAKLQIRYLNKLHTNQNLFFKIIEYIADNENTTTTLDKTNQNGPKIDRLYLFFISLITIKDQIK